MSAAQNTKLIYADGTPVPRADVKAARMQASVAQGGLSPWPYDAASRYGNEINDWFPFLRSPDSEINFDADIMRARSRDLVRNDGWAAGSITRIVDGMVGSNFHVVPQPNWRALQRIGGPKFDSKWAAEFRAAVISEWRMWAEDPLFYCDAGRSMNMTQLFYQAARHKLVDGDALGMPQWMPENLGYGAAKYATAVNVIDPDRLSNPYEMMDTHWLRGGVELGANGAPVAYHIRRAHQNDSYDTGLSMMWDRFERQTDWGRPLVVHDCDRDRAGQHRGIGILTPVLPRFKVLAKYDQVALQAALMRTVFGFFIKSPYDDAQVRQAMETMDTDDRKLYLSGYQSMRQTLGDPNGVSLAGAKIPVMAPGEDIVQVETHGQAEDFDIFEHTFLRGIASCTGESAEEITKDYTHTNYSSARAALLSVWRTMLRRRAGYTTGFCTPIYVAWLEEAVMIRKTVPLPKGAPDFISMRAAYGRCEWIGPGRGWIDPVKERQGEVLGLDAGFGTLRNTCADISGMWWQDVIDERAVEEEYMRERGLTMPDWAAADPVPASLMEEKPQPQ